MALQGNLRTSNSLGDAVILLVPMGLPVAKLTKQAYLGLHVTLSAQGGDNYA